MRDAPLAVVEPLLDELLDRLRSVPGTDLLEARLADPGGAEHGQVVAVPLIRDADAPAAHADHVLDVLVIPLHADRREDEAALLVHVTGIGHVGGRLRVAAVGLVRLRGRREHVPVFPEDRHEDDVIRRVGVPEIRVVVQERVALGQIVMQVGDGLGEELHPDHVHREALGRREQAVVGRDQSA